MVNLHTKTRRSLLLVIFGLPFFLFGTGLLVFFVIPSVHDYSRMQSWLSVPGKLTTASLSPGGSSSSGTQKVEARYRYTIEGVGYTNDRVAITTASDNIGDFQKKLGGQLVRQYRSGQPVTVWYDPADPYDSILNRDMRWGLFAFKIAFVLVFGGIGLVFIIIGLRGRKVNTAPAIMEKPWLKNPDWKDGIVTSGAKLGVIGAWVFAVVWNLVSFPVAFKIGEIWLDKGPLALVALVFPVVGIGLLFWAIKVTLGWRRFGRTPLTMDPFPGAIGGDVGGEIQLGPYHGTGNTAYKVTLSCIYSYMSGSGKNRSRSEDIVWQDEGYARPVAGVSGLKLQFRFRVPDKLAESDDQEDSSYHLWRLHLHAELDGVDLDRDFELPVYATGQNSSHVLMLSTDEQPAGKSPQTIESILPFTHSGRGIEIYYPALRKPLPGLMLVLFGGVFAAVGVFLWQKAVTEGVMLNFMSIMFSLVGLAVLIGGIYTLLNSLRVTLDGMHVTSVRSIVGIPVSRKIVDYDRVLSVSRKKSGSMQKGSKHQIDYHIIARYDGGEVTLAEHLTSYSKTNQVIEFFKRQLMN
jgi:hypothetical protein